MREDLPPHKIAADIAIGKDSRDSAFNAVANKVAILFSDIDGLAFFRERGQSFQTIFGVQQLQVSLGFQSESRS